jgi:hypothetical protein
MGLNQRRAVVLVAGLALAVLAGCGMSNSTSSDPPFPSSSLSFADPSESEEPSAPQPPASADVTGTWEGTWLIDPPYSIEGGFTMEIVQSGGAFNGTVAMTNTDCSDATVEGTINGSSLDFGWITSTQPIEFIGTLNGTSMSGTWSSIACSDGTTPLTGTWEGTKR